MRAETSLGISSCRLLGSRQKPRPLQASAQAQPGAVEHYPAVGRGDPQFLTDLLGFQPHQLAHGESASGITGKRLQASLERLEETPLLERAVRTRPILGGLGEVAVRRKEFFHVM